MKRLHSNVKVSDIESFFGGDENKTIVGKAILATKKIIYKNRERGRDHDCEIFVEHP